MNYTTCSERERIIAGFSAREVLDYVNIGGYVPLSKVLRAEREVVRQEEERTAVLAVRNRQWDGAEESRVKVVERRPKRRRRAA